MKTELSTRSAYKAALNEAEASAEKVIFWIQRLRTAGKIDVVMPQIRAHLANTAKFVHEANAYHNVINTK